jgi:ubiquinone/menaquinone biosynthesis C-methylase UbiE
LFIGDRLNIFEAMHGGGALTAQDLAAKTGLDSRLLYEWLKTLAIARYVEYHPDTEAFSLPEAHGEVLANSESPFYAGGAVQAVFPLVNAAPFVAEALETGIPVNAEQYAPELWDAMDRDLFVIYQHSLVQLWLPALDDVTQKLEEGGAILDYGCGRGRATLLMGRSYPNTQVTGIDPFGPSVEAARRQAGEEGLSGRVRFEQGSFDNLPSGKFDLITALYVFHHLPNPVEVLTALRGALKPEGRLFLVNDRLSPNLMENTNEWGRYAMGYSVLYCLHDSMQNNGAALGVDVQAPEVASMARAAGFSRVRRLDLGQENIALDELRL